MSEVREVDVLPNVSCQCKACEYDYHDAYRNCSYGQCEASGTYQAHGQLHL